MASEGHLLQKARQRKHRDGLVVEKERAWGTWLSWGTIGRLFLFFFFVLPGDHLHVCFCLDTSSFSLFSVNGEPLLFCLLSQATPAQHAENWTLLQSWVSVPKSICDPGLLSPRLPDPELIFPRGHPKGQSYQQCPGKLAKDFSAKQDSLGLCEGYGQRTDSHY